MEIKNNIKKMGKVYSSNCSISAVRYMFCLERPLEES